MRTILKAYQYGIERYYIDNDLNRVKCVSDADLKETFRELVKVGSSRLNLTLFVYAMTSNYNLPLDDRIIERLAALRSMESLKDICVSFNDFLNRPKLYTLDKAYCGLTIAPVIVNVEERINNKKCFLPPSCLDLMFAEINGELLTVTEISELLDKMDFPIICNKDNNIIIMKTNNKLELCPVSEAGQDVDMESVTERVTRVNKSRTHKEFVKLVNLETGYFEEEMLVDCFKIDIKEDYKDILFKNIYK